MSLGYAGGVMAFGGIRPGAIPAYQNDVWLYRPAPGQTTALRREPTDAFWSPRARSGIAVAGVKLYIIGGETAPGAYENDVWELNRKSCPWVEL